MFGTPLIWHKKHWLHQIYCVGLENFVRSYLDGLRDEDEVDPLDLLFSSEDEANSPLLFWMPATKVNYKRNGAPSCKTIGYCLLAKEQTEQGVKFNRIIQVQSDEETGAFRMYSCREFNVGDAITFISKLEERTQSMVLGGIYCRIANDSAESNAYLTLNRVLRCSKAIKEGDEITRIVAEDAPLDHLERVDTVVLSTKTMKVGTISAREAEGGIIVNYADGSMEVGRRDSDICFAFRNFGLGKE